MANLQDIADELRVSPSLVSKVLSGRLGTTGVSLSTQQIIRRKAKQLGYRTNRTAAALATGRQNALGVFFHGVGVRGSGIMESLLQGIASETSRCGQRLVLHFFESAEQFIAACSDIHPSIMDGMIIGGIRHRELVSELRAVRSRGIPLVTMYDQPVEPSFVNVTNDQVRVGRLATEHLIERGCRRIATVNHTEERYRGYVEALNAAGLSLRPNLVCAGASFEKEAGEKAVRELAARRVKYDGFVAQSDSQAIGAFNELMRLGRRVPQDVKLIGIDNSSFCELNLVPLSSVSQEEQLRGQQAVRLLLAQVAGGKAESLVVEPVLVARESSM